MSAELRMEASLARGSSNGQSEIGRRGLLRLHRCAAVTIAAVATATNKDVWRAVLTFTVTSALIGLSSGVLARTSGLSLAMTCALSLLVFAGSWNLGTLTGALAGGAIGDPATLGLDAAFPASMLALLAPLLRRRDMRAAALAGGAIALTATPFCAPGVPIMLAAAGALVVRVMREEPA